MYVNTLSQVQELCVNLQCSRFLRKREKGTLQHRLEFGIHHGWCFDGLRGSYERRRLGHVGELIVYGGRDLSGKGFVKIYSKSIVNSKGRHLRKSKSRATREEALGSTSPRPPLC